jgi:hypothetical protein
MNRQKMWHPLAGSIFAVSIVAATVAGTAFVRADDASSKNSAWVARKFDFSVPALNFESNVSRDATVETVPMEPTEPGTIGKVKVIGKIAPGKGDLKVETTMVGYNLHAPATALRICSFDVEALGYTIRIFRTAQDLTEAKLADEYAASFIDNLSWENGQQSSFGEDLQTVPLLIGDKQIRLSIPNGWDIPINDFRGRLPAELHIVRRKNRKDVGLVWLFVQDMKEKPDLDTSGAAIVKDYFVKQTPDARAPVLLASGEDSTLAEQGIASRTFRFSVENKQGSDAGDIEATVVWHNGRLSVLTLWSAWPSAANRNTFFSRLPGLTVYDIVRQEALVPQL